MSLPVYRSSTSGGDAAGTTLSVSTPAGVQENDILLVILYIETTATVTATGWTEITAAGGNNSGTPSFNQRAFWRRAVAGEAGSHSFTWDGSNVWRGYVCAAYSGCVLSGDPTEAANYAEDQTGSATITGTGITTLGADRKAIFGGCFIYSAATSFGNPNAGTRRANINALAFVCDQDRASAGATGNYTIQANNAESGRWTATVFALIGESAAPVMQAIPDYFPKDFVFQQQ